MTTSQMREDMRVLPMFVLLLAVAAISGCVRNGTASISGQGVMNGNESRSVDCTTGDANLFLGVQGSGSLRVLVTDGAGHQVYEKTVGTGQNGESVPLHGARGSWTLKVSSSGYAGQYGIEINC